jgi:Domain of unknown function (DUF4276)
MYRELVFLLEEASAQALLETLLIRLLDQSITARFIVFEGKQDLERQVERRLRLYQNQAARFLVLRDQDSAPDCHTVKATLLAKCHRAGRAGQTLVRIACRELETFYIADLAAVETALERPGLAREQQRAKFRDPDNKLGSPSAELYKLTGYQKVRDSRLLGNCLNLDNDRSASFKNLISAIRRLEADLLALRTA